MWNSIKACHQNSSFEIHPVIQTPPRCRTVVSYQDPAVHPLDSFAAAALPNREAISNSLKAVYGVISSCNTCSLLSLCDGLLTGILVPFKEAFSNYHRKVHSLIHPLAYTVYLVGNDIFDQ